MNFGPRVAAFVAGDDPVCDTALSHLERALDGVAVHRVAERDALEPGGVALEICNGAAADSSAFDSFELFVRCGVLHLRGSTPRGLLQAVYAFEEMLREDGSIADDLCLRRSFALRDRIFHVRFDNWPGQRADVEFISRMGASHCLLVHDWQGDLRHFQGYVTSPIFPDAVDADRVRANHGNLRQLIDRCGAYGLETCLWMTELPCQGGPWVPEPVRRQFLERFPAEILSDTGTYQGRGLCFGHPQVRDFYRDLVQRFFAEFPEISILFLFGLDADGEFCDPDTCPRCAGLSKFEQRDRLIRFLVDEGQKVRPGLRVLTTGWGWERMDCEQFLSRQEQLPAGSGLFMPAEYDGWQAERQTHHLLSATRDICRRAGQLYIGYDNFLWGDDTVHGLRDIQDFPLGIGAKIRRWRDLAVDGVFDHWGGFGEDIWSNAIACREFFLDPNADIEGTCRDIALRQFGPQTGATVFQAWCELERAHAILSDHCHWSPQQWPGWNIGIDDAATPAALGEQLRSLAGGRQPEKLDGAFNYNPPELIAQLEGVRDSWQGAAPHYESAIALLEQALETASDEPVGYSFWWSAAEPTPTARQHVQRQIVYLKSVYLSGREIGLHFGLLTLYESLGRDAERYLARAPAVLPEVVTACRDAGEYFAQLEGNADLARPHFAFAERYLLKAQRTRELLAELGQAGASATLAP